MPTRYSDFEMTASDAGVISFTDKVSLPISVKITEVFFETLGNCMGRGHQSAIHVDGNELLAFNAVDCQVFSQEVSIKLTRGAHAVQVMQDGYDPNEVVKGKVGIEYQISLF
jgi:hypothetical protein